MNPGTSNRDEPLPLVALTDHEGDKYTLLEKALTLSGFFPLLEQSWKKSGKAKKDFRIVVKPNLAMMLRRSDVATYTDPFLVIHLLRLLLKAGYENLAVVESQNLYGNWFENRSVCEIAWRAGYLPGYEFTAVKNLKRALIRVAGGGVEAQVPLIDMTLETVPHNFGPPIGEFLVGRAWKEADFRINFPKLKTHFYSYYTLAIKNIYGALPQQDKVRAYHCQRVVGKWTAALIREFPVHFNLVDAYTAADGWLGVKIKALPKKTHTIIAGEDPLAIDHFGASLLGLKPEQSLLYRHLAKVQPLRPYRVIGDYERPRKWRNPPGFMVWGSVALEANATIMDFAGSLSSGGHDACFPPRLPYRQSVKKLLFLLSLPVAYFSDLTQARLRQRRKKFFAQVAQARDRIPLLANSRFLCSRLPYLGRKELEMLIYILRKISKEEISFSGHFLFCGQEEVALPSRLSSSVLATFEFLKQVQDQRMDAEKIGEELTFICNNFPQFFGEDQKYPYCYQ